MEHIRAAAKTLFRHLALLQKTYDMIQDDAGRTGPRDGLAGFLNKPNAADILPYSKAARVYSSSSTPKRGDLGVVLRIGHGEQVDGLHALKCIG